MPDSGKSGSRTLDGPGFEAGAGVGIQDHETGALPSHDQVENSLQKANLLKDQPPKGQSSERPAFGRPLEGQQGQADFRNELLRRFFDSRSYFFRCFSNLLASLNEPGAEDSERDYATAGQLMNSLVSAGNITAELDRLAPIPRFGDFSRRLADGVAHLHRPFLEPDDIKREIESLAQYFTDSLLDTLHSPADRKQLERYLGQSSIEDDMPAPPTVVMADSAEYGIHVADADEIIEGELEPPSLQLSDELPQGEFGDQSAVGIWDVRPELEVEAPPLKGKPLKGKPLNDKPRTDEPLIGKPLEGKPFAGMPLKGMPSIDINESVLNDHLKQFDGSAQLQAPDESAEVPVNEPKGLQLACRKQLNSVLQHAREVMETLAANPSGKKGWREVNGILKELREVAMIHGVEELDDLSFKSHRFLETYLAHNLKPDITLVHLHEYLFAVFQEAVEQDLDRIPKDLIVNAAELVSFAQRQPQNLAALMDANIIRSHAAVPAREESQIQDHDDRIVPSEVEEQLGEDLALKLPGEDDEEIVRLVREVAGHTPSTGIGQVSSISFDDEGSNSLEGRPFSSLFEGSSSDHLIGEAARPEQNEVLYLHEPLTSVTEPALQRFWKEVELHFTVLADTLTALNQRPEDRMALENLELVSGSIKTQARKLDLDDLADFPEHVEELVSQLLTRRLPMPERELGTVRLGFERLALFARSEDRDLSALHRSDRQLLNVLQTFLEEGNRVVIGDFTADSNQRPRRGVTDSLSFARRAL